jgi:CRP-like cAMP-binding protein
MEGVIPMPYEVAGKPAEEEGASELTASILRVLGKLKPGDTLNRAGLAFEIDEMLDHTNGHFNRILKKLREDGKITSEGGYQLARKK